MANYRTIKELTPYKGYRIRRLHKDGEWYYFAGFSDDDLYMEGIKARSLKDIKKTIDALIREGNNMTKLYTLDELYDRAIGAAFLSRELKAKDEAMFQTEHAMRRIERMDDSTYIDEDELLEFSEARKMKYDTNGNLIC